MWGPCRESLCGANVEIFYVVDQCRDSLCGAHVEILYVVDQCRDSLCGAHVGNLYVVGGSGRIWEIFMWWEDLGGSRRSSKILLCGANVEILYVGPM